MTRRTGPRMGFTLVELLIVIAIIAVLMALLLPAIAKVRTAADRTAATHEMSQLTTACTTFKTKFGFMPPDTLKIPTGNAIPTDPAEYAAYLVFLKMYPRWDITTQGAPPGFKEPQTNTVITAMNGTQVLAYFLGGPEQTGWRISGPATPLPGDNSVHGPFYDFKKDMFGTQTKDVNDIDVDYRGYILDPWETPYAYFSTGKSGKYGSSEIVPHANLLPFKAAANKWESPSMIQLVSAGPDTKFGRNKSSSGIWTAGSGEWAPEFKYEEPVGSNNYFSGSDDMSNFHQGVMGAN